MTTSPQPGTRILVVDDNPDDRSLVRRALERAVPGCDVVEVGDAHALEAALGSPADAVVTDYSLRWSDGLSVFGLVQQRRPGTPVVMFTGTGNEEVAVAAMKQGLSDYVVKDPAAYRRLPLIVQRAVERRAERVRLATAEGRYRHLVELVPAVIEITALDEEATPQFVSPQVEGQLGYRVDEWLSEPDLWRRSIHPDDLDAVVDAHRRQLRDLGSFSAEYRVRRRDGSIAWIRDDSIVVRDDDGSPLHALGFRLDVTDRHELEDRLRQAEKMEAVGQLASGIAHDVNNVLTIIRGNAEHIGAVAPGADVASAVAAVIEATERAAVLTARLLAFSRRRPVHPEPLDLVEETRSLLQLLNRLIGPSIDLSLDHEDGPLAVVMDRGHYAQVLINLAVNARDAIDGPGHLRVKLRHEPSDPSDPSDPSNASGRGEAVVVVEDDGPGIPPEAMGRVFEPFFTTKGENGTGLGLATVWSAVQASGGTVRVTSARGEGARFEIRLPAADPAGNPGAGMLPGATLPGGAAGARGAVGAALGAGPAGGDALRLSVLVVEDEPAVQAIARRILERHGALVTTAADGPTAIALLESGLDIDVLLTDLNLPGAAGPVIIGAARATRPGLPVLLMSGALGGEAPEGVHLLAKPFSAADLVAAVEAAVAGGTRPSDPPVRPPGG